MVKVKKVAKAQKGMTLTEMGKKTTKAAVKKRTDDMAKSLDKASVFGKSYVAPSDSVSKAKPKGMNFDKKSFDKVPSLDKLKKKIEKKKSGGTVSMQLGSYDRQLGKNYTGKKVVNKGAKAKMGKSMGKCKYGC